MKKLLSAIFILITATSSAEDISQCISGWSASQNGDHKKGISLLQKCAKEGQLKPTSLARTYRNIGIVSNRSGQYKQAIEYYNKALKLKPKDYWKDYINRGNAWSGLGEYAKALADFEQTLRIKPNYNQAFYNQGIVYERQHKPKEAVAAFLKAYHFGLRSNQLYERLSAYNLVDKSPQKKP
jgi:tetratricopeptide (TPR) repeat protein